MPNKLSFKGNNVIDAHGGIVRTMDSENGKDYAVIARCGHCGKGYYIPIMFTANAEDEKTAIKNILMTPRIKRDAKMAAICSFEISREERYFIESINDHDPYLRGYALAGDAMMNIRRLPLETTLDGVSRKRDAIVENFLDINTRDDIPDYYVLERLLAPYYQGNNLIIPKKLNKDEVLHEHFRQKTIQYGIKKLDSFFPALYYQRYGKDNDLGIVFHDEDGTISFQSPKGFVRLEVQEGVLSKLRETLKNKETAVEKQEYFSGKKIKYSSQIDKFNRRMEKHNQISATTGFQPGEE